MNNSVGHLDWFKIVEKGGRGGSENREAVHFLVCSLFSYVLCLSGIVIKQFYTLLGNI